MSFIRTVKLGQYLYRHHQCIEITHKLNGSIIRIRSTEYSPDSENSIMSIEHLVSTDLDLTMTFDRAEAIAKDDILFTEYIDSYMELIDEMAEMLTDDQAADVPLAYPEWESNIQYNMGVRVRYDNIVYRCLQAHTSQDDWSPDRATSLWVKARPDVDPEVIPDWEQPTAENPYMTGDKVRYNGHIYVSLIDNNIWSPADYPAGWQEVINED